MLFRHDHHVCATPVSLNLSHASLYKYTFNFPWFPQAQIDYLRKELYKKNTPKYERDTLAAIVTEVQQQLQHHQQKLKEQQQQQKVQHLSTDKQHKEHHQSHFIGKVYIC